MGKEEFSNCWYKEVCETECSSSCIRFLEMNYLVEKSGLPEGYRYPKSLEPDPVDYEMFCKLAETKDNILEFVSTGSDLYIGGSNTGTGKTTWASKLMLKYFNEVWAGNGFTTRGMFVHVPSLVVKLKDFNSPVQESYKNDLLNCDLVIWDDIASTNLSNYDITQLLIYIDTRILNGKANIYTGNITEEHQLESILGARLTSRIWHKSNLIILNGKDRRH